MTTITFKTKGLDAERLFAMLQAYGVEDLTINNEETITVSEAELESINKGLEDLENGHFYTHEEVQNMAEEICIK